MLSVSLFWTVFWQCWFAISGVGISLVAELLDERGVGNPYTGFQQYSQFIVMFICGIISLSNPMKFIREIKNIKDIPSFSLLVICDFFGSLFTMAGIYFLGSGLFQIMYSMVIPISAFFQIIILGKTLHFIQWISIIIVIICLILSCYAQINISSKENLIIGLIVTLLSTVFNSLYYVFIAKILLKTNKDDNDDIEHRRLIDDEANNKVSVYTYCALEGFINLIIISIYIAIYVVPNWNYLVSRSIKSEYKANWVYDILLIYIVCAIFQGTHMFSLYVSIDHKISPVAVSINKAFQSSMVFIFSAVFYCKSQTFQCLNDMKIVGAVGVILAILLYGLGKKKLIQKKNAHDYEKIAGGISPHITTKD